MPWSVATFHRTLLVLSGLFLTATGGVTAGCGVDVSPSAGEGQGPGTPLGSRAAQVTQSSGQTTCTQGTDPFLLPLPEREGMARVVAVSERPIDNARLLFDDGTALSGTPLLEAGPPYARLYSGPRETRAGSDLSRRLRLVTSAPGAGEPSDDTLACIVLPATLTPKRGEAPASGVWATTRQWDAGWERAFSAWIAWLFRPLPGQPDGWRPLHQVLRNPARNLLFDSLGLGEDSGRAPGSEGSAPRGPRVTAWADCGDAPYQLRAYFAWKQGLPFRFRRCTRGTGVRGPQCYEERNNHFAGNDGLTHPVLRLNAFLREGLAWLVHSGTTRTLPEDEGSDFYPIRLSRETIRPGTIFVDVGGHVLVVTQWDASGLWGIDGHPDFSVTRRRFSPEFFRYFRGTRTGGFKAFRPLGMEEDRLVPLPNRRVRSAFSVEQYGFASGRDFYQTMGLLMATVGG